MKPDPDKVADITQIPAPQNKPALLWFFGMINYLSPFCANLSSEIQLLRMLAQEGVPFMRSKAQEQAFNKAKELIASVAVLAYYNLNKPSTSGRCQWLRSWRSEGCPIHTIWHGVDIAKVGPCQVVKHLEKIHHVTRAERAKVDPCQMVCVGQPSA